jgi:CDP-diacylglycerol--serine O-phosphatidyltransferase
MRKHIPNIITLANLFSGCIAIVMAFEGNFPVAVLWVILAALFDFLDGFFARLLKAYSAIGKELDSLCDVVSFGVAPAAALFVLLRDYTLYPAIIEPLQTYVPYLAFFIPLFSVLRLAKFNIDERQTTSFIGLPTPANGLFWISYCVAVFSLASSCILVLPVTFILIVLLSLLMVSEIPMFSLKLKKISWKGFERQWILVVIIITLIALYGIAGIAWGMLCYILLSLTTPSEKR